MSENTQIKLFKETIQARLDRKSLVMSDWICKNFPNPRNDRLPWSFKDHEFQIEIANVPETDREVVVTKCAQVGLTTLQIRLILGFLATHDYLKAAYVLPTASFAREFTQSRLDPTIEGSPVIAGLVSTDTDNTSIKRIGTCFLIMRGTSGTTAAISVDLDLIIIDELNFAVMDVVSSFESRLQHSDLKLRRDFSTPTLPGYGVSALYAESSKGVRLVKHEKCEQWVEVQFFNDVVIPGFDKGVADFRAEHLGLIDVHEAYYKCSHCGGAISEGNMADPDRREWVHQRPGHFRKGFQVTPWDVPRWNPLHDVLSSIRRYSYADWNMFRLGLDYESSENSFMESVMQRNSVIPAVSLQDLMAGGYYGLFIGVDLGKVCHVVIGAAGQNGLDILCAEQVEVSKLPEQHMGKFLVQLFRAVRGVKMISDAAPDYSVSLYIHSMGCGYGAYYGTNSTLDILHFDDVKGVVRIDRDLQFDELASEVNAGRVRFPVGCNLLVEHFKVVKKVTVQTAQGMVEKWTSTSTADHFAHATLYCWAAYASVEERFSRSSLVLPPTVGKVRMRA